jgi:hypothetical protein
MKQKMKKLTAVLMAVAMVLSFTVTAFATGSGGTVTSGGTTTLPARGQIDGGSQSEGPLPDDPVEVVLPTIPTTPARYDGAVSSGGTVGSGGVTGTTKSTIYDIILDPHGLIKETNGARYAKNGVTTNFSDSRLYFLKDWSDTSREYDGQSKTLTIQNKGRQPVSVDLSLNFNYDPDKFTLVDNIMQVTVSGDTIASGDETTVQSGDSATLVRNAAAMYFALQVGTGDKKLISPVVDPEATGSDIDPDVPFAQVSGRGDYLAAFTPGDEDKQTVAFEFAQSVGSGDKTAIKENIKDLTLTLSYIGSTASGDALEDPIIRVSGTAMSGYSVGSGDTLDYEEEDDATINIRNSSGQICATITLSIMEPNRSTMKQSTATKNTDQTIKFKFPQAGVIVQTAIDGNEDSYEKSWENPSNASERQGMTEAGYFWKLKEGVTNFPTLSFKLLGNINKDALWDYVNTNPKVTFELIWDVMQMSTYYDNVIARNGAVEAPSGGSRIPGNPPTVTVEPATGTTKSTRRITLTWTPGTDGYTNYVPDADVVLSDGTTATFTVDSTAHTMTYNTALSAVGVTGTITFRDSADTTKTVEVTTTSLRTA